MIVDVMDRASDEPPAARHYLTHQTDDASQPAVDRVEPASGSRRPVLTWLEVLVGWVGVAVGWTQQSLIRVRRTLARNRWARAGYRWMRRPAHARIDRPPPLTGTRVAERLAELLAPVIVISATALLVALATADSPAAGVGWAALAVLFCVVIPEARNWLGTWRDEHEGETGVRAHRRRPVVFGLAPMVVGLALLLVFGAPGEVVALMVAMFGLLHAVAAVRRRWHWRPSVHAAVTAGCATALVAVFGSVLVVAYLAAAAVGWARVVQGERSSAEAVGGAVIGILIAAPTFLLFG